MLGLTNNSKVAGKGYGDFVDALKHMAERTVVHKILNTEATLLSFKERKGNEFLFYKIDIATLSAFNNGDTDLPIIKLRGVTESELELLGETATGSGILLEYNGQCMFVAADAVNTLAERAEIRGKQLLRSSLARNLFIAEGLFNPEKRAKNGKPLQTQLICRKAPCAKNGSKAHLKKVFAALSDGYVPPSLMIIKEIIDSVAKEHRFGICEVKEWIVSNREVRVQVDFPNMGSRLGEKYGLGDKIVPGFCIIDSDIGRSAFRLISTYRINDGLAAYIGEKSWEHTSKLVTKDILDYIQENVVEEFYNIPEAFQKLAEHNVPQKKLEATIKRVSKELGLVAAIGKKNEMILMKEVISSSAPAETEYDVAMLFYTKAAESTLLTYAEDKLRGVMGSLPFLGRKEATLKWVS